MVEEKIDKDGFIVTTQEESVPKEDREFAINVYSNNGEEICTVYTNNPTVARKYEKFIKSSPSVRSEKVYAENGKLVGIQGVLDLDVASVRIYKTTKGKTSDESSEARKARMRAVRAHKNKKKGVIKITLFY